MDDDTTTGQNRTPIPGIPNLHGAPWWVPFLVVLANTGNVSEACKTVQIARSTAYEARDQHPDFAAAWDEAMAFANDALKAEIRRRAVEGVDEPVFYKGRQVATIRRYSDALLMFLAKSTNHEFRERIQIDGLLKNLDLSTLSTAQLARLAKGEDPLAVLSRD